MKYVLFFAIGILLVGAGLVIGLATGLGREDQEEHAVYRMAISDEAAMYSTDYGLKMLVNRRYDTKELRRALALRDMETINNIMDKQDRAFTLVRVINQEKREDWMPKWRGLADILFTRGDSSFVRPVNLGRIPWWPSEEDTTIAEYLRW